MATTKGDKATTAQEEAGHVTTVQVSNDAAADAINRAAREQARAAEASDGGKVLTLVGMADEFGPIRVGEGDDAASYTINRLGTFVPLEDLDVVRDTLRGHGELFRQTAPKTTS